MDGLHDLRRAAPRKGKKRVGRGIGSGSGKTSGKGQKGQKARSGGTKGPGFEGGQIPLQRRLPMRGFNNKRFAERCEVVNLADLNRFEDGTEVTPELLRESRLVRRAGSVKVLAKGEIEKKLTVRANAFSRQAAEKIAAAGGKAEVI